MLFENEIKLLCDTFAKCHVHAVSAMRGELGRALPYDRLEALLGAEPPARLLPPALAPHTVYKMRDALGRCYIALLLSDTRLLFIGPYLGEPVSEERMAELGEGLGLDPKKQRYLREYYASVPIVTADSHLFVMLHTLCEHIWERPSFAIVDLARREEEPPSPLHTEPASDSFNDIIVSMEAMEKRYAFENEMIEAVSLGQLHKEGELFAFLSDEAFEKRIPDALRNAKNYSIIMNTLLRKAAERGGVHPLYLDRVSSDFALRIEALPSLVESAPLMLDMFRTYCRLVRKHATERLSPLVQKVLLLIDSDLSADLSLGRLAKHQGVSEGYLSTVFKAETGKTLSAHIREKRIRHAMHLLRSTSLQIQTVALHSGIMDVQYFSKIFKRETGKTPKEYRETADTVPKI